MSVDVRPSTPTREFPLDQYEQVKQIRPQQMATASAIVPRLRYAKYDTNPVRTPSIGGPIPPVEGATGL